ncbi:MAG: hypothetical protein OXC55_07905 [Chloroflexi bacterium]|nr:hypothetical protein [Chloroflexota bacterium]
MTIPTTQDWLAAFEAAPSLAQDSSLLEHVRQRFHGKYLETIMRARNEMAEDRAWEGFYFWMVFPETNRKPFEIPPEEASALLESLKPLVVRLREGLREQHSSQA